MFTGKTLVDGEWVIRRDCRSRSETLGAVYQEHFSRKVTLVVHGELAGNVKDMDRGLSRKLLAVMQSRKEGRHIHVVDAAGYSDLLFGAPARCRDLKMQGDQVTVLSEVGDGYLGGPFDRLQLRTRGISRFEAEFLGRGTPQHEKLLSRLVDRLGGRASLEIRGAARRGPQFDLGWIGGRTAYGAWVASPRPLGDVASPRPLGDEEPNQLREAVLHVGRSVRSIPPHARFQPVVVLDNSTALASELKGTAQSIGVLVSKIADLPDR